MKGKSSTHREGERFWGTAGLYFVCCALAAGILAADVSIPLGVAVPVLYVIVVWLSLWSPYNKFTFAAAVICSLLTVAVFFYQPIVSEIWKSIFNRGLALFAIWLTAVLGSDRKKSEARREKAVREREKALEETRILRGLLPICASCKKIRDDQGNWMQMEKYIKDRSEAEFSHGICPECAKKLYPDITK